MNNQNVPKKSYIRCKIFTKSPFDTREGRSRYAYENFKQYYGKSVLDIGGYQGALGKVFKGKYTNIDLDESADLVLNLDKIERLPFEDKSFDTVVATDVLEHLEHFHLIFDEICRCASKYIIISLPNQYSYFQSRLDKGFGSNKHLGLPVEVPKDRHRWFFSFIEANEFIKERGARNNFEIEICEPHIIRSASAITKGLITIRDIVDQIRFGKMTEEKYINSYASIVWWVLKIKQTKIK